MTAREYRERCYLEGGISLPAHRPYPRPGRWAMVLLPLVYVLMGAC